MTEVMETMFEGKQKEEITGQIKQIPLSDSTATRIIMKTAAYRLFWFLQPRFKNLVSIV